MPRKSYPSSKAISGMYFPSSASSGNCIPFQASILGCIFRLSLIGKRCPTLRADCGMHFPVLLSLGKCIPFLDRIMGRNFPLERLWESVSHFDRPEWDALSAKHLNGKLRPIPKANSGTHFSKACPSGKPVHFGRIRARNHRPIRPPINKEASSRTAGHEVHREFRTQRRPLNVAFVLRRTVEQGTSCPDAREGVAFRR